MDSLGNFQFNNLGTGKFLISVSLTGFERIDTNTIITLLDKSRNNIEIILFSNCKENAQTAKMDIKKGKLKLLLQGGISPIVYQGQEKFEQKYKVEYYDFGCIGQETECSTEYNFVVFDYLDKKYGKEWRGEIRNDVIGFKK